MAGFVTSCVKIVSRRKTLAVGCGHVELKMPDSENRDATKTSLCILSMKPLSHKKDLLTGSGDITGLERDSDHSGVLGWSIVDVCCAIYHCRVSCSVAHRKEQ